MSEDFDKSNFDKSEPQTPGKVEFIGHTAKHIPGALRYNQELGRPMFSILHGKHTKPECSCGLSELYDSERFHIQCDTTISKGHFVNTIIEAINTNFDRESLVFDLGSDAVISHPANFFVRCDGTVFVNGKKLQDGGPPEQRLQPPKPRNRDSRPPPWPENPLRQQWLNWIHTVLFGSRNLPSVQSHIEEQTNNLRWQSGIHRPPIEEQIQQIMDKFPYPEGSKTGNVDAWRANPEAWLDWAIEWGKKKNLTMAMGELQDLVADVYDLKKRKASDFLPSEAHLAAWLDCKPSERKLFANPLCHHCECLMTEELLRAMGLQARRLPPLFDLQLGSHETEIASISGAIDHHHKVRSSNGIDANLPKRGIPSTYQRAYRIEVWGWRDLVEDEK